MENFSPKPRHVTGEVISRIERLQTIARLYFRSRSETDTTPIVDETKEILALRLQDWIVRTLPPAEREKVAHLFFCQDI